LTKTLKMGDKTMKAHRAVTRTIVFAVTIILLLMVSTFGLTTEKATQDIVVDKTVLTIDCENAPESLFFTALLYGNAFEECERTLSDDTLPYTLDITPGNFMGIIQVSASDVPVSVTLQVYRDGVVAAQAYRTGKRILIRQRGMFPAAEVLD
jgi:hypothetical protein